MKNLSLKTFNFYRSVNLGAGVYGSTPNYNITAKIPITIVGIDVGVHARDSVTSQYIRSSLIARFNMAVQNPALDLAIYQDAPRIISDGHTCGMTFNMPWAANDTVTLYTYIYLETVTANQITVEANVNIKYLCNAEDLYQVEEALITIGM